MITISRAEQLLAIWKSYVHAREEKVLTEQPVIDCTTYLKWCLFRASWMFYMDVMEELRD